MSFSGCCVGQTYSGDKPRVSAREASPFMYGHLWSQVPCDFFFHSLALVLGGHTGRGQVLPALQGLRSPLDDPASAGTRAREKEAPRFLGNGSPM